MRAALLALAFALSACASAAGVADAPAPFTGAAPVAAAEAAYPVAVDLPAGTYRLDPRHASVLFRIRHMELAWFTARFDTVEASLELDPADPTRSRITASIDPQSVNTGVLNAQGERGFDRQIGRALGGEQRITFASTAIERTGRNTARITGDLTMNGQTHPATLEASFAGGAADPLRGTAMVLGFSAHGVIDRSQWGVTQWSAFAGDDVQLVIEVELVRS
jgi:polyisoprenoid-binding protein YceI